MPFDLSATLLILGHWSPMQIRGSSVLGNNAKRFVEEIRIMVMV